MQSNTSIQTETSHEPHARRRVTMTTVIFGAIYVALISVIALAVGVTMGNLAETWEPVQPLIVHAVPMWWRW